MVYIVFHWLNGIAFIEGIFCFAILITDTQNHILWQKYTV